MSNPWGAITPPSGQDVDYDELTGTTAIVLNCKICGEEVGQERSTGQWVHLADEMLIGSAGGVVQVSYADHHPVLDVIDTTATEVS